MWLEQTYTHRRRAGIAAVQLSEAPGEWITPHSSRLLANAFVSPTVAIAPRPKSAKAWFDVIVMPDVASILARWPRKGKNPVLPAEGRSSTLKFRLQHSACIFPE